MAPMLYVLIFLATVLAVEGMLMLVQSRRGGTRAPVRRRLRRMAGALNDPESGAESSLLRRETGVGFRPLQALLARLPRSRTLELRLYRAGLTIGTTRFLGLSAALAAAGWLLGWLFLGDPIRGLLPAALGLAPWVRAGSMARKRVRRFEEQFPEALELLTRSMRAGHSFTAGLQMVGEELPDPVGTEFLHVAEEIKFGQEVPVALQNLAYRINAPDLPFFVTAVSIQRETGGNLAEVLEKLGYVIRERFTLYGKVRALTAIGRASANLLALWPVVMVGGMYLLQPTYVEPLWTQPAGRLLVLVSAGLVVLGYFISRKMASIRV